MNKTDVKTLPSDPNLPILTLPPVPHQFWALLEKLFDKRFNLEARKSENGDAPLLRFLEHRGYALPIEFWLPSALGQPELYKPWLEYVNPPQTPATDMPLKPWADVKFQLQHWRDNDPAAFRDWLAARFSQQPSLDRQRLLTLFYRAALPEDEPFLTQVATKDRAKKVKALAEKLLLRLQPVDAAIKAQQIALVQEQFEVFHLGIRHKQDWDETKDTLGERYYLLAWISAETFAEAFNLTKRELLSQLKIGRCDAVTLEIIAQNWLSDDAQDILTFLQNLHDDPRCMMENRHRIWRLLPSEAQHDYLLNHTPKPRENTTIKGHMRCTPPMPEGKIDRETFLKTPLWQYWQGLENDIHHYQFCYDLCLWLPPSLVAVIAEFVRLPERSTGGTVEHLLALNNALLNHTEK